MTRVRRLDQWALFLLVAFAGLRCAGSDVTEPPPEAERIAAVRGDDQTGVAGTPLPDSLVVVVTDDAGAPVQGVEVAWSVEGGGSVSASRVTTGANGQAAVQRVLGSSPGAATTRAAVDGLEGSPVVFTATVLEAGEPGLSVTRQPPSSVLDRELFAPDQQPTILLRGASGTPVAGVAVTAEIASGSGTLEGTTSVTTRGDGVAAFTDLGIAGTGPHTLRFVAGSARAVSTTVTVAPLPPEASKGKWDPPVSWDIVPLHMNLMPNGNILAWGKTDAADTMGMPRLWNPSSGPPSGARMIMVDTMLFCAGHTLMPDGRLMISGGHLKDDYGIAVTYFASQDGAIERGPDMAYGRWYPTVTVLPDGRLLTMAGRDENGEVVKIPEIWEGNRWEKLPGAGVVEIPYYPRNFVAPNGRIFYAGERITSRWFDVDASASGGRGRWTSGPGHKWPFNRDYGTAVMYEPGKILYAGGGGHSRWGQSPDAKTNEPTATAEVIDLDQASPSWQFTGSMSAPRRHLNSTILPDGQVLVTGGTRGGGFVNIDPSLAVREAEVWNPNTGEWTTLASAQKMRVYHSVSLLLPDGTVLHGASGDAMAIQPGGEVVPVPPERNHEIFRPPYLFKGARPTIASAPSTVGYGQTFTVATPHAAQITDVRWIRLGAVTHAFDMGQRANTLSFTRTAAGVEVTAPASPNLAPPGHYLLFILNRNGVPSVGKVIQVQ